MAAIPVSPDDIDALAGAIDTLTLPPGSKELLSTLVTAVRDVIGDGTTPVRVIVQVVSPREAVASLQGEFDSAFTPDPDVVEDAAVGAAKVGIMKIGR